MEPKQLFVSHFHEDDAYVDVLTRALRAHGIVPWVDHDRGLAVSDLTESEIQRAIRDECQGLLFFASGPQAFTRPVIRKTEIYEGRKRRDADPHFLLFAVPRGITFERMQQLSQTHFGYDLAQFNTMGIAPRGRQDAEYMRVANGILGGMVKRIAGTAPATLALRLSTTAFTPTPTPSLLHIDARKEMAADAVTPDHWRYLLQALQHVKGTLADAMPARRLALLGNYYLGAGFLFGRVFTMYEMDIEQTTDGVTASWRTDVPARQSPLIMTERSGDAGTRTAFIEISFIRDRVSGQLDRQLTAGRPQARPLRLQFQPAGEQRITLDAGACRAIVAQVYEAVCARQARIDEIHLFAAMPQAFMVMLGKCFRALPPVTVYEFVNNQSYQPCLQIPGGHL